MSAQPYAPTRAAAFIKWSSTAPTEPGHYWVRPQGTNALRPTVKLVYRHSRWGLVVLDSLTHTERAVGSFPYDWAGPLPEPVD